MDSGDLSDGCSLFKVEVEKNTVVYQSYAPLLVVPVSRAARVLHVKSAKWSA